MKKEDFDEPLLAYFDSTKGGTFEYDGETKVPNSRFNVLDGAHYGYFVPEKAGNQEFTFYVTSKIGGVSSQTMFFNVSKE